jgi:hypothetical protein
MDQLSSATNKHFKSLIELVEAGYPEETDLRPPIEDDAAPIVRVVTPGHALATISPIVAT